MSITAAPLKSETLLKTDSSVSYPARYPALDSLRGLAALSVLLGHFLGTYDINNPLVQIVRKTPIFMLCEAEAAVYLFFILSGFVLALPYVTKDKSVPLLSFYVKRVFRIYPAFAFSIIMALIFQHYLFNAATMHPFSGWMKSFWTWDIQHNFKEIGKTFSLGIFHFNTRLVNPVIWTLIVEMKMSLLLPFLLFAARKLNIIFNVLLLLVLILKNGLYAESLMGLFYIGILLAKYKDVLLSFIHRFPSIVTFSIAIILYSARFVFHLESYRGVFLPYISGIGATLFILMLFTPGRMASALSSRPLHLFGKWSYSFYLFHFLLLIVFCSLFSNTYSLSPLFILLATFIGTIVISAISYQFVELPFQALGKRLVERYKSYDRIKL
jgi:peptidoglycan/LPS O-acetylase OafA/YrhL